MARPPDPPTAEYAFTDPPQEFIDEAEGDITLARHLYEKYLARQRTDD